MKHKIPLDPAVKRRGEYDDKGDQLDDIMRFMEAVIEGKPIPKECKDAVKRWRAVKDKYPKPEKKK